MDNVKYQVFISSTYSDLVDERRKILDVLLMADCIPAGMEAFVATDTEQFDVIKKVIFLCDYYVLIIGKRYGSVHPTTGISYTEMEYDYAIENDIPVLVFAIDESVDLPKEKVETDSEKCEKLKSFRERAMTNRLASIWTTPDDLVGKIAISIMKAKNEIDRLGWVRGQTYQYGELLEQINDLRISNEELKSTNAILSAQLSPEEILVPDLADGEDYFTIHYSWRYNSYDCNPWKNLIMIKSWNELFVILGDCFKKGCTYTQYEAYALDALQQEIGYGQYRKVNKNDIRKIKFQFEAMGLIKAYFDNSTLKREEHYVLSKEGINYLAQAAAVKKNEGYADKKSLLGWLFKK